MTAFQSHVSYRRGLQRYRERYGFGPPPAWSDVTRYEPMLDVILNRELCSLDGDFLEIGAFFGGGTYKLSNILRIHAPSRKVVAVDVFDPGFDQTLCSEGVAMAEVYDAWLANQTGLANRQASQREIFDLVTKRCTNVEVIVGDSTKVIIPTERLAFSFIDGHHASEYVLKDFATAWERTVPGGVVALHDYGHDLPSVTRTVHSLIGKHTGQIGRVWTENIIVFLQRDA